MRITPIEIHQKKFKRGLRGYSEEEVDAFLDEVALELERLIQENEELSEKVERLQKRLEQYQSFETALQETMLAAQKAASDLKKNAENAAKLLIKDAQLKAEQIKKEAQLEKEKTMAEVVKLKLVLKEYRNAFESFLEGQKQSLEKIDVLISQLPSFGALEEKLESAVVSGQQVQEAAEIEENADYEKAKEPEVATKESFIEKTQPVKSSEE